MTTPYTYPSSTPVETYNNNYHLEKQELDRRWGNRPEAYNPMLRTLKQKWGIASGGRRKSRRKSKKRTKSAKRRFMSRRGVSKRRTRRKH